MINRTVLTVYAVCCIALTQSFAQVESLLENDYLGFFEGTQLKSWLYYTGNNTFLINNETNGDLTINTSDDLLLQTNGQDVGIGSSSVDYKLDVVGDRIRLRESTATDAHQIMLRTDGTAVDLQAENADLFLRAINNDININPFPEDGNVWVNGTSLTSGGTIEEFNVVSSDMNLEDTDPYIRLIETPGGFDVGGINFKNGSSSVYWLNYDFAANQFYVGDGHGVADADFLVDGTTGDITVSNDIKANGDIDVTGQVQFGSVEYFADGGLNEIMAQGDVRPVSNNTFDLGTSTYRWDDVYATNGTIQTSDASLKKNVQPIKYGLDEVLRMNPVQYQWNSGNDQESVKIGLVAQEVLKITPEVVKTVDYELDDNDEIVKTNPEYLGMNYSSLIPVLIKAIQEQESRIKELESKLN